MCDPLLRYVEDPTTHRVRAVAGCTVCQYLAQLTGDSALEVGTTLRRILLAHIAAAHPDQGRPS